jgi:hypothetical protein
MPLIGSVLLTMIIVGFIVYQWRANRRKIGDALRGRYHSGGFYRGISLRDDEIPAILDRPCEHRIYPGHPLYNKIVREREGAVHVSNPGDDPRVERHFRNSRHLASPRPDASGPASALPSTPAHLISQPAPAAINGEEAVRGPMPTGATRHRPTLSSDRVMPEQRLRRSLTGDEITEVTSGCPLCDGELEHTADCPRGILLDMTAADRPSPYPADCTCHPDDRPAICQRLFAASECVAAYRAKYPEIAAMWADEGEPLAVPPQPNIGGEGHPDYQGPHYLVEHDRFVPYDVLRDPIPGAAVHIVGSVACVGPLEVEREDRGHADTRREEDDES